MTPRAPLPVVLTFCISVLLAGRGDAVWADDTIGYNRDIRPILAENCFACHGPDSASRKADLRLDRREAAIEAEAIVPGQARRERADRADHAHDDATTVMPPAEDRTRS